MLKMVDRASVMQVVIALARPLRKSALQVIVLTGKITGGGG